MLYLNLVPNSANVVARNNVVESALASNHLYRAPLGVLVHVWINAQVKITMFFFKYFQIVIHMMMQKVSFICVKWYNLFVFYQ